MGSYLSKPLTKIDSSICENDHFIYCTAEMQGWRKTQEVIIKIFKFIHDT